MFSKTRVAGAAAHDSSFISSTGECRETSSERTSASVKKEVLLLLVLLFLLCFFFSLSLPCFFFLGASFVFGAPLVLFFFLSFFPRETEKEKKQRNGELIVERDGRKTGAPAPTYIQSINSIFSVFWVCCY